MKIDFFEARHASARCARARKTRIQPIFLHVSADLQRRRSIHVTRNMLALCIAAVAGSCTDGDLNLKGVLVAKGERPEIELCPGFIHYERGPRRRPRPPSPP